MLFQDLQSFSLSIFRLPEVFLNIWVELEIPRGIFAFVGVFFHTVLQLTARAKISPKR